MHEDEEEALDIVDGPCLIPQGRRERGAALPPPPTISWSKIFFHVKLKNIKFLHLKNIWDLSVFIEQDISDKK